ncbi:site-specific integrase [Mucilaginibacter ginkgonis]|uniref:Site-specific integrase n=1 Tax=Mucilaginibacter ginkgonis TaxID=2682091 RepID=A0A7T7FB37_9SPHI|nr:site-specific integrase [Mucilaginibacter ginkgonis]QQL50117.1 site-specific integrase [Mucilaginibacter ginkgonis]
MKVNEDLSILFWLKHEKGTKDGKVPIYVRITVKGRRDNFSSGKKLLPEYWNDKLEKVAKACPDANLINSYITKTRADIEKCYNQLSVTNNITTAAMVKELYMPKQATKHTLMKAFDAHNGEFEERISKGKGSIGTLKRYERLRNKVIDFLGKKYKHTDINLDDIQYSTAADFYHYLIMQDIDDNAAFKYVKTLKQVVKKAVDKGWIKHSPINGFKCPYNDPDREYLEMHEIISMYNKHIPNDRLSEVRDAYIFCCFTGYAYETVYNLEPGNIFRGLNGRFWITKERAKTGSEETVPLLPIALEIIEKYKSHPYCTDNNKLLPVNCNQRYNSYLKEVANICNINKHLTTHTARHTFATTVTLENDVPIETVSKMLGHKDLRTTQIYAKITKLKISNNMADLESKLFNKVGQLNGV